jgi:uncharacterized membrane protein YraQ (UPF0718 family)
MRKNMKSLAVWTGVGLYFVMLAMSRVMDWSPGQQMGTNLWEFIKGMAKVFPCAFILIGLFDVWVKKETVERHMGQQSGWRGYVWALLLAGTTVGGMFVGFPVAYALHAKGAKLSVTFTYIGAAAICRVPMTLFEAFYLGGTFTLVRFVVSVPLVIVSSILLGNWLTRRNYHIMEGK